MNTKERGDLTEAIAVAELKRRGYTVSVPVGETARYDILLDAEDEILRIQCKTAWMLDEDRMVFKTCSTDYNASGHHANRDYEDEIDAFLVRLPKDDTLYFVPIEDAPSREMTIRHEDATHPNQNVATEFRLDSSLP